MGEALPDPLVPAEVDLHGLSSFMLDVERLLASELVALGTPEECWAALMLWCRAWQQKPAASLPDDDRVLAAFSKAGRRWPKVKKMALRGFRKCSDGRLYHPVLAEEVLKAWKKRQQYEADQQRLKRWRDEKRNADGSGGRNGKGNGHRNGRETHFETGSRTVGQGQYIPPVVPQGRNVTVPMASDAIPWTKGGDMPEGTPPGADIVWSYHELIRVIWCHDPPAFLPRKDVSIAQGWIDSGADYEAVRALMEERMRAMEARKQSPPSLRYFDEPVRQMSRGTAA